MTPRHACRAFGPRDRFDLRAARPASARARASRLLASSRDESPRDALDGRLDGRRQPLAGDELLALDAVDDDPLRQPPSARESSTASPTPNACVDERKTRRGHRPPRRVEAVQRPRLGAGATASTTTASSAPSRRRSGASAPARSSSTSTPAGTRCARARRRRARRASSLRYAFPIPITTCRRSPPLDLERRGSGWRRRCRGRSCGSSARRARAARRRQSRVAADDVAQVVLDRELVLRGRRHDLRVEDRPLARRAGSGGRAARAAPRSRRSRRRRPARPATAGASGSSYTVDQPQRLVAGVHELDAPHDDAAERIRGTATRGPPRAPPPRASGESRSALSEKRASGPQR